MTQEFDVLVIGGGATGGGTALDLALRGLRVALVERADLTDGTSGRYHGLLHSGGRYAVRDPESARECIEENRILRRIVPHAIEDTGGFFVTTPDDDPAYADKWLAACRACGIEAEEISVGADAQGRAGAQPGHHPRLPRPRCLVRLLRRADCARRGHPGPARHGADLPRGRRPDGRGRQGDRRNRAQRRTGDERHLAAAHGRQRRGRVGGTDRRHGRLPGDRAAQQGHDGRDGLPVRQHHHQPLPPARRRRHPGAGRHRRGDRHDLRQRARPERHQHPGAGKCASCWTRARRWCPASARCARCGPGRASARCTRRAARARAARPSAPSPCWITRSATASAGWSRWSAASSPPTG